MHRCSFTESSLTQLPNEYNIYVVYINIHCMQVYCGRYFGAGGDDCLKTPRSGYTQVQRGRCKDTGGDQFLKRNYNFDLF